MEAVEERSVLEQGELSSHGKHPAVPDRNPQSAVEKQFWEPGSISLEWQEIATILGHRETEGQRASTCWVGSGKVGHVGDWNPREQQLLQPRVAAHSHWWGEGRERGAQEPE